MEQGEQDQPPENTSRDGAVAAARVLAGMVPVAGPIIAELITELVPGQRRERVDDWLRQLAERLAEVEKATLRERVRQPENMALIEEGAYEAAWAISEERRRQLAGLVAGGISDERREYLESRRLLRLLGELDDAEVVTLASYLHKHRRSDYGERHADVLKSPRVHLGSSREEGDAAAVREAGKQHLLRLGLLEHRDQSRISIVQLTSLGRLLLRRVGLADENDF